MRHDIRSEGQLKPLTNVVKLEKPVEVKAYSKRAVAEQERKKTEEEKIKCAVAPEHQAIALPKTTDLLADANAFSYRAEYRAEYRADECCCEILEKDEISTDVINWVLPNAPVGFTAEQEKAIVDAGEKAVQKLMKTPSMDMILKAREMLKTQCIQHLDVEDELKAVENKTDVATEAFTSRYDAGPKFVSPTAAQADERKRLTLSTPVEPALTPTDILQQWKDRGNNFMARYKYYERLGELKHQEIVIEPKPKVVESLDKLHCWTSGSNLYTLKLGSQYATKDIAEKHNIHLELKEVELASTTTELSFRNVGRSANDVRFTNDVNVSVFTLQPQETLFLKLEVRGRNVTLYSHVIR